MNPFKSPGARDGDVDLTWTSPGDDGMSEQLVGRFVVKYSTNPIVDFYDVLPSSAMITLPADTAPGTEQTLAVSGLYPAQAS